MRPDDRVRLLHMIEAAETAIRFAAGRSRAGLDSEQMLAFALVRAVEVLGEAASRVSESGRLGAPDIPWPLIIAMRNRLIHAYFDIDLDILWKTVTEDLPGLLPRLRAALPSE